MIGFLCATPLHVMSAVNLKCSEFAGKDADLFVLNHFPDVERLVSALEEQALFRRVEIIDENVLSVGSKVKRLMHAVIPSAAVRRIAADFSYDRFIFFALDFLNASYLIQKGQKTGCAFYYGEDGLGSYINDSLYSPSKISDLLLRITGRKKYLDSISGIYLYEPELRIVNHEIPALKCPKIDFENERLNSIFHALWPTEAAVFENRKALYFEEPIRDDTIVSLSDLEHAVVDSVISVFGEKSVYVKKHPRMKESLADSSLLLNCDAPFERIMGCWDQDQMILLSVLCTAVLQPAILSGKHPSIVFLYRIAFGSGPKNLQSFDLFVEKFRCLTGSQVYVPETLEELRNILSAIAGA